MLKKTGIPGIRGSRVLFFLFCCAGLAKRVFLLVISIGRFAVLFDNFKQQSGGIPRDGTHGTRLVRIEVSLNG